MDQVKSVVCGVWDMSRLPLAAGRRGGMSNLAAQIQSVDECVTLCNCGLRHSQRHRMALSM